MKFSIHHILPAFEVGFECRSSGPLQPLLVPWWEWSPTMKHYVIRCILLFGNVRANLFWKSLGRACKLFSAHLATFLFLFTNLPRSIAASIWKLLFCLHWNLPKMNQSGHYLELLKRLNRKLLVNCSPGRHLVLNSSPSHPCYVQFVGHYSVLLLTLK